MIRSPFRPHLFLRTLALAALGLVTGGVGQARAEFIVALGSTSTATNVLQTFDSATPSITSGPIVITGVAGTLLDIDFRPANGSLYGLSNTGQLYTINTGTGLATLASTLIPTPGVTPVFTGLGSSPYAIDFNPTVDRLRVVSTGTGQNNLRVNVDTGTTLVDGTLTSPNVVGAAYANSFSGASTTTLYDLTYINSTFFLNTQNPPNNGTINPIGTTGIVSASSLVGFDISGASGLAYVAYNTTGGITNNGAVLSTIDLTTGNVSSVAFIDGPGFQVRGLAAPVGAAVPEPASVAMVGLGLAGVGFAARRKAATN